jgi:hypothetical protein
VSDTAAIVPAWACGVSTIPVAAWLGRRTWGAAAGIAAAAFAALSGPHVAFSRMALTDAPFLLTWLIAIGLGMRFLEQPRLGRAVGFGIAIGVAENFKYSGWLIALIVALAAVFGLFTARRRESIRAISLGIIAVAVAAAVYAPWFVFVERHQGYFSLLAHQRGYVDGLAAWPRNWNLQMAQSVALAGIVVGELTWAGLAWVMAWLGAWALRRSANSPHEDRRWKGMAVRVSLLGGLAAFGVMPNLPWWLGLCALPWMVRSEAPTERILGVWWLVLSILTPLYHPYVRLWLPVQAVGWIIAARVVVWLAHVVDTPCLEGAWPLPNSQWKVPKLAVPVGIALVLATAHQFGMGRRAVPLPDLLAPSDSLRTIAARVNGISAPPKVRSLPSLLVLARPPVTFYLNTVQAWNTIVMPDWGVLSRSRQRLRVPALVDEVQLLQDQPGRDLESLMRPPTISHFDTNFPAYELQEWQGRLNLPTLLDVSPESAFVAPQTPRDRDWGIDQRRPSANRPVATIWYLGPGPE